MALITHRRLWLLIAGTSAALALASIPARGGAERDRPRDRN
ncbi:hypothetical protein [Lamprobacter modestohalophilus]|nr:hypothetical protein [Lamprobacter modestohalophilus]